MINYLKEVFTLFSPPEDADPAKVKTYRARMQWVLLFVFLFCIFVAKAMHGAGVPLVQFKLVSKAEMEKAIADRAAKADLARLEAQVAEVDRKQQVTNNLLMRQLLVSKSAAIRGILYKRCIASNYDERERLNQELEELQSDFYELAGKTYAQPRCNEL